MPSGEVLNLPTETTNRVCRNIPIKTMPVKFEKKQKPEKPADFSSWSMPEQEMGVIKCREHDFL